MWSRPYLGLYEVCGSRNNNVVLAYAGHVTHNFAPFVDRRPGVPPSQRYKVVGRTGRTNDPNRALLAYVSSDGIRWTKLREEPIIKVCWFSLKWRGGALR